VTTRSYHHGNLRTALVETAAELARAQGPNGVVLREVARRTGVSHNAAYRHFADREELLAEVAQLGMDGLEQAMLDRMATVRTRDPRRRAVRRLRQTGRAYVQFALAEPGLFEVAFSTHAGEGDGGPYALLNAVLDEMVGVGAMPPERRAGADVACWAGVHGFAMLHLHGPLREVPAAERDAALDRMLDLIELALAPD
jgi:AcrR family transcriptional regulator